LVFCSPVCDGNSQSIIDNLNTEVEAISEGSTSTSMLNPLDGKMKIYPNPAKDLVTIETEFARTLNYSLTFIDVNGKSVLDVRDINQNEFSVDVGFLTDGVYILRFELENGETFAERLIIH